MLCVFLACHNLSQLSETYKKLKPSNSFFKCGNLGQMPMCIIIFDILVSKLCYNSENLLGSCVCVGSLNLIASIPVLSFLLVLIFDYPFFFLHTRNQELKHIC